MASIILKSGTTLLDYAISTVPDTLQISTSTTHPSQAVIQIVVSNPDSLTPIYVDRLQVTLPMGIDAAEMLSADDSPSASISISGTGDPNPGWTRAIASNVVTFNADDAPALITTTGLVITLYNINVSTIAGAFEIRIKEYASLDEDSAASQHATAVYVSGKFSPQLYLSDFWATSPQVAWGGSVTLQWNCSHNAGATMTFGYQPGMDCSDATMPDIGNPAPASVQVMVPTGQNTLTVTQLTATTTFLLAVTETAGPQSESLYASVTVTVQNNQNYVPIGAIALWSNSNGRATLPLGWQICNGQNGTPDLRDRFIVGAGSSSYAVDSMGNGDTHTHGISIPTQTFTTASGGHHSHHFPSYWYDNKVGSGNHTTIIDRDAKSVKNATTTSAGDHTHTVSISYAAFNSAGAGVGSSNNAVLRPKWYALYYIMRIS